MSKKSRSKGCAGERQWRDQLREAGFLNSRRGQQFSGSPDSPDVICTDLPEIHWEVKRCESGSLYAWLAQAIGDAKKGNYPIVAHRKNNCDWVCILRAQDLLDILRRSDLCQASPSKKSSTKNPDTSPSTQQLQEELRKSITSLSGLLSDLESREKTSTACIGTLAYVLTETKPISSSPVLAAGNTSS